ncbi:hypothetical protein KR093_003951, partial [Drosophila rubida]
VPQCFHFTWLGPYENKSHLPKENCESRVGDFNGIPCEMPLVATTNDSLPDVKALWHNATLNREHYLCQMSPGYSCVKYSYIFKGGSKLTHTPHIRYVCDISVYLPHAVQNITYMCAKVNSSNGCFRQRHSTGMQVEACVCTSRVGLIPCNRAPALTSRLPGLAIALLGILHTLIV